MDPEADSSTVNPSTASDEVTTQANESGNLLQPTDQEIQEIFEALFPSASPPINPDDIDHIDLDAVFSAPCDPIKQQCAACQKANVRCILHSDRTACNKCRSKKRKCEWGGS